MNPQPECPLADAVVARYLDGEADAGSRPATVDDEIAWHRRECASCRRALERSRRLDALVAAVREPEPTATRIDGWLEAALGAVEPVATPAAAAAAPARSAARSRLVAVAACVAIAAAIGVGYRLGRSVAVPAPGGGAPDAALASAGANDRATPADRQSDPIPQAGAGTPDGRAAGRARGAVPGAGSEDTSPPGGSEAVPPDRAAAAPGDAAVADAAPRREVRSAPLPPGAIVLSELAPAALRRARTGVAVIATPSVAERVDAIAAPWLGPLVAVGEVAARLRDPSRSATGFGIAVGGALHTLRAGAAAEGFAAVRPGLDDALLAALAGGREPVRVAVAAACRADRAAIERFVAAISPRRELEADRLRAFAAVRAEALDAALVDWAARDAVRVARLAVALRAAPEPTGVGRALLALWEQSERRGLAVAEILAETAVDLGPAVARQVAAELRASAHAAHRQRALRLLGAIADPAAADALFAVLQGARRDESVLAAWALGRLPADADDVSLRDVDPSRRALWCAVLASRRQPTVRRAIEGLSISAAERAFLDAGGFTPEQIPIAAALFRDRSPRGDL